MSRLPTLATPSRPGTASPGTAARGIPTPSIRRPRSSLGPGASPAVRPERDHEMDQALRDVLRNRPPSSLSRGNDGDGPDTPTPAGHLSASVAVSTPRTPAYRPKTPSSMVTPTSRPQSRPSLSARSSLIASTTTPAGRRTSSIASSTSTPINRPESRAGEKWTPAVGDRVRLPSHGYEGTLRYLGTTHIREGIWAGVELEGAFKGRGRNDGTVDGQVYFKCAPDCGIFTLANKLAPPTSVPSSASRPASVASHRSLASSYSASGRMTPASERIRRGATTPSHGTRRREEDAQSTPTDTARRTLLGNSTATNAARAEAKITAGSRASKYLGVTAKQLSERGGSVPAPSLNASTATVTATTPKAVKTLAASTNRVGRLSLGGSLATPKARGPRASEMMPPPPSPSLKMSHAIGAVNGTASASSAALEDEIRELKKRNAALEEQVTATADIRREKEAAAARVEELQQEIERVKEDAANLHTQLSTVNGDSDTARARAEELQANGGKLQAELDSKTAEIAELKKEMALAAERAAGELEAGMVAKREEVRKVQERAETAELEASEMKRLVDELTLAGNQIIELNESKQFNFELQIRELEEKLAKANEELKTKEADGIQNGSDKPITAAQIDNETLTEQVKHLQNRISSLEEQLDEARGQADSDSDAWQAKYNKAREAEKQVLAQLDRAKGEIETHKADVSTGATRINELQVAVKENQSALEAARAEIESLRAEASAASAARSSSNDSEAKITELEAKLEAATAKSTELEGKMADMQEEMTTLRSQSDGSGEGRRARNSNGSIAEAEKSILGYHHIVNAMKAEVAQLHTRNTDLMDEIAMLKDEISMLKEENKLLQEINESDGGVEQEVVKLRTKISQQTEALKEYEREVSELEALIEAKIYHEDELESRLQQMQRDATKGDNFTNRSSVVSHSRTSSVASNIDSITSDSTRCELCEGPHDLDACPVFAGTTLSNDDSPLAPKGPKKWCNDCESAAHNTDECPMADDVF